MAATYLDRIIERHREVAASDRRPVAGLEAEARAQPAPRGFIESLRSAPGLGVIAEIKRRSPSKGDLFPDLDPRQLAATYERGGARCLSVLTDREFFGGSPDDLRAARSASRLPVIRKDFTVCERDVYDARIMGADCVLLIAAALDPAELRAFHALALDVGLDVLVEIHDEAELEVALGADATLIGVNQRDLVTFEVDHDRAVRMAAAIPDSAVKVAESGVRDSDDASALRRAGYRAVLVGESLVTSEDPEGSVQALSRS